MPRVASSKPIATIEDFLSAVTEGVQGAIRPHWFLSPVSDGNKGRWYYRGQPFSWKLIPSVGAPKEYGGAEAGHLLKVLPGEKRSTEYNLFNRFQRYAYEYLRLSNASATVAEWEALFLARHWELPTRLLDWSQSPLVALYFALDAEKPLLGEEGAVWGFNFVQTRSNWVDPFTATWTPVPRRPLGPSAPKAVRLVFPVYNSERLVAQKGVFTWHSHPAEDASKYPYSSHLAFKQLLRLRIAPADEAVRRKLIQDLDRLGVNQRTIFPDIGGITKGLWQREVLFEGDRLSKDRRFLSRAAVFDKLPARQKDALITAIDTVLRKARKSKP